MALNPNQNIGVTASLMPSAAPGNALGTLGNVGAITGIGLMHSAEIVIAIPGGNTGGTLDVYLQTLRADGVTWTDYAHLPQLAAGAGAATYRIAVSKSTPTTAAINPSGNLSIAANTLLGGEFGNDLRLALVSGAGTTAVAGAVTMSFVGSL